MRLGILALCASVVSVSTGVSALGDPGRPSEPGDIRVEARVASAPVSPPRLVRQYNGTIHIITATDLQESSDGITGKAGAQKNPDGSGPQSLGDEPAGERGAIHIRWGRSLDLAGQPIDFSRSLRSSLTSVRAPFGAFLPGAMPSSMPVAASALTSGYGMRDHPLLGVRRAHMGVDLAAPSGSPIVATSDGIVSIADWRGGYGLSVSLEHGGGIETRYGHMSRLNVFAGQSVHKGDVIGFVGSTGLSTGPHLHYEVRVNGRPINPAPLLKSR